MNIDDRGGNVVVFRVPQRLQARMQHGRSESCLCQQHGQRAGGALIVVDNQNIAICRYRSCGVASSDHVNHLKIRFLFGKDRQYRSTHSQQPTSDPASNFSFSFCSGNIPDCSGNDPRQQTDNKPRMSKSMQNPGRHLIAAIVGLLAMCSANVFAQLPDQAAPPIRYAPPEAIFDGANQLQLFKDELDQKQFSAAAARMDALLRDSGDALLAQGNDASVISIAAWMADLPVETKNLLRSACETNSGETAQRAVEDLQAKPDTDPSDFYQLSRRYPLCRASLAALAEAARRGVVLGDVPTAHWMLDAATTGGWLADPKLQHEIDQFLPRASPYVGPLPFAASWCDSRTRQGWAALRSFPTAAGDTIFVVGPAQVIAMKDNGVVLWQGPAGAQPMPGRGASAPMGVTRGPPFAAAVLCDATGTPQLLVVRQPEVHGTGWALRALRASDGHLLWTTEGQEDYQGLIFGSNPAVVGRYVYAIAGDVSDQLDHLYLVALEVTTGRQLWRCDIGTESRTIAPRPRFQPAAEVYRPWLNESAPAVTGNQVVLSPNIGAVIAVGRFDGKLHWTRSYQTLSDPTVLLQRQRDWALEHPTSVSLPASGVSLRWANTPAISDEIAIAAPQDSDRVLAVSLRDGKLIAQSSDFSDDTLVGAGGGMAVMEGPTISALRVTNGTVAWKRTDQVLLGPAIVVGTTIIDPTPKGLVNLSAQTGSQLPSAQAIPAFHTVLASQTAREILEANDVLHCFTRDSGR